MKLILALVAFAFSPSAFSAHCYQALCVGDHAIHLAHAYREVEVLALEDPDLFVLRYLDTNTIAGGVSYRDLALTRGCSGTFCVGSQAYNRERQYRLVTVVGLQSNGLYVLRFEDNGAVGRNWPASALVPVEATEPPYVPPHPPVVEWVCHLVTPSHPEPGYVGRGNQESGAFSSAMQQCLTYETPYQCRKNSEMRCAVEVEP